MKMKRCTSYDVLPLMWRLGQSQEYNNLLDHNMPQRPTTHKDLQRAAIGSAFALAYFLAMLDCMAENTAQTSSAGLPTKSAPVRLVKNEPAKPVSHGPAKGVSAPVKSISAPNGPATAVAVPAVKSAPTKSGKLREIPLSTLTGEKAIPAETNVKAEAKVDSKATAKTDSNPAAKADSESGKKTDASSAKNTSTAPVKKTVTAKAKKSVPVPRLNNGLIPPPPPIVPIGMDVLGMYAQPVDYLSMKDLEARKKELALRFNELDSTVKEGERQIKERKERAELFESLYQEGVVSRKELEIAKREAGDGDRDFKFRQDELESVKVTMKAVNNRLAVLKKMEAKMNVGKPKSKKKAAVSKQTNVDNKQAH